jgi:hypothetical protein
VVFTHLDALLPFLETALPILGEQENKTLSKSPRIGGFRGLKINSLSSSPFTRGIEGDH